MNLIRQRHIGLRNRARQLQTALRRWALYTDSVSRELKEDLLAGFTPAEQAHFDTDLDLVKSRLRGMAVPLRTVTTWYDYVLERINEQLDCVRPLIDQGHHAECLAVLGEIETRWIAPNEETLGYFQRALIQHASHEFHQKLAGLDAIIRDLYLPTVKLAHQRGLVPREALSRTPLAFIAETPEQLLSWRQHVQTAVMFGRRLPLSMMPVPRSCLAQPWSLVAIAHEVGQYLYSDLDLAWEMASKLQTETTNCGISPQTASIWSRWHTILFADVFGVLKFGPAYVGGMIEMLSGGPVFATDRLETTPPAYVRWQVMLQTLQLLNQPEPARDLFQQVHALYGDPTQIGRQLGPVWMRLIQESRAIAGIIALSPCQRLAGARVVDVAQPSAATEFPTACRVKDLLLSGDDACATDETFGWVAPLNSVPLTAATALSGVRLAFETSGDFETARRVWIRFWCLMQYITGHCEPIREREDREFAPGDAVLRHIAQNAMPTVRAMPPLVPA